MPAAADRSAVMLNYNLRLPDSMNRRINLHLKRLRDCSHVAAKLDKSAAARDLLEVSLRIQELIEQRTPGAPAPTVATLLAWLDLGRLVHRLGAQDFEVVRQIVERQQMFEAAQRG